MSDLLNRIPLKTTAALAVGAVSGYALYQLYEKTRVNYLPVGNLTSIWIYPIKSCRGIEVEEATCDPLGLRCGDAVDRSFLITDNKFHFITARQENRLLLVQPSFQDGKLYLDAPGMETLKVEFPKDEKSNIHGCKIWGQVSRGLDCGREPAAWLERFLGRPEGSIHLLHHPWKTKERIPDYWEYWERYKKTDACVFADLAPFHVINEASVADLKTRIEDDISYRNFRPNFVVNGSVPYAEDDWKYVTIGDNYFRGIRPCTRCILTTINPETGVRGTEPLNTLKTYRQLPDPAARKREGDSPVMGRLLALDRGSVIRVGDIICASV